MRGVGVDMSTQNGAAVTLTAAIQKGDTNMKYRNLLAGAMAFALAAAATGCGDKKNDNSEPSESSAVNSSSETTAAEETTEEDTTEAETEEERLPPEPVEASDPNAVTFDDGDFSFASVVTDDDTAASGVLSVEELMGNKMLKFTDDNTVPLEGKVQKLSFNAAQLIGPENLPKVRRIEFDLYARATADHFVNEDGENVFTPGWVGGGGGTVTGKDDKWYDFKEFAGGEYDFEVSGAVHGEFKFLLADGGMCWSEDMTDANFLIMRWGISNEADLYIDNIVFYDENDNSIPIINEPIEGAEVAEADTEAGAEVSPEESVSESSED